MSPLHHRPRSCGARKDAKRRVEEEERLARVQDLERAGLPLSRLEAMLVSLATIEERPCDHTHRHIEAFLAAEGVDVDAAREALVAEGAGCDCEAILNIDLDSLKARPSPQPPPPTAAPRGTAARVAPLEHWTRGRFSLPVPKAPWKLEEAGDALVLRFGGKNSFDSLRLRFSGTGPDDEKQVCRQRWIARALHTMRLVAPDDPAEELTCRAAAEWESYRIQLAGPAPWTRGRLAGREYVASAPNYLPVYTWVFFGEPGDGLMVELGPSGQRRAEGDRKELERVLDTLTGG